MKMTIFELKKLIRNIIKENSDNFSEFNDNDSYEDIKKTHRWKDDNDSYEDIKKTHRWKDDDDSYEDIKKTHRLVKGEWPKMDIVKNPYEDIKKTHRWKDDDDKTFKNESTPKKRMDNIKNGRKG